MKWKYSETVVIFSSIVFLMNSFKKGDVTNQSKDTVINGSSVIIDSSMLTEGKMNRAATRMLILDIWQFLRPINSNESSIIIFSIMKIMIIRMGYI